MDDLVKTARRAKGSDLLPKVSFGTMNAEGLILRMADRIESDAEVIEALKAALADIAEGEPDWPDDPAREWQWCRKRAKETLAPFSTAVEAREKGGE